MLTVVVNKKFRKLLLAIFLVVTSLVLLCACGNEEVEDNFDYYGEYDDITKTLQMSFPYSDTSSFLTNGAGYATVTSLTDGDTTNFKLSTGQFITIRYYGVDTPESTGQVQKWGKAATHFVSERLSVGMQVILEATTTPAEHDSYGTRYLGYIWYRADENSPYKLLNLELVENGLSKNKCVNTNAYKYYTYFKQAEDFAKNHKLRIHGDYKDPYYSTSAEKITLKDFYDNTDAYYNSDLDAGSKVRFQAYITDLEVSNTGTYTYKAKQIVDGKTYEIDIYCGYSSATVISCNAFTIGNLYSITGSIAKHNGSWQVAGIIYSAMNTGGDYLTTIQANYYLTFDNNIEFTYKWGTGLYSDVTVVSATMDGENLKIVGTAMRNSNTGYGEPETYTFVGKYSGDITDLAGKTFSATGFQTVKDSKEISVNYNLISFK